MKIALTHTGNPEKHQFYINWLRADNKVEVVTVSAMLSNLDQVSHCNGLLLSGGMDIHPAFYHNSQTNYPNHPDNFDEARDRFEISAFELAQNKELPVLGICRGLQLINVIHKGTLIQDLGESAIGIHKGNPDKSHSIMVSPGSLLHSIIGTDRVQINSAHHQAIDKLGEGLLVNARSTDGVIEGVEREQKENRPFLLAVQWHPERMFHFNLQHAPASLQVRNRFIEEIKKSIKERP